MKLSELKNYTVVGSSPTKPTQAKQSTSLGQKVLNAGTKVAKFVGAEGISEQFGANIAQARADNPVEKSAVQFPSQRKVIGSAIQTGANFLPGVGKGVGMLGKVAAGAGTGYAFDVGSKLQGGEDTEDALKPGVGTAVGAGLPVAGSAIKLTGRVVGRLLKGLGSSLSGVSTKTIDAISQNPEMAKRATEKLAKTGNNRVLEKNARQVIEGVSGIKRNARKAFGEGLEQLADTDIDPAVFRTNTQSVLDKYGVSKESGKRILQGVEFDDPKNLKKASELIDRFSKTELNGKSLRKLADDIENSAYKVATGDERLSFNAFIKDLSQNLRNAVKQSTPKLGEIDQAFSQDMQLAEAVENIFGKVNYKNLSEVVKASQKLESLFSQKGLAPEVVDDFLTKIGIEPGDFRASEAVRQISDKVAGANTKGLGMGELMQNITSSVVTPQMVRDVAMYTGMAEDKLIPFFQSMKPAAQKVLLNALMQAAHTGETPK